MTTTSPSRHSHQASAPSATEWTVMKAASALSRVSPSRLVSELKTSQWHVVFIFHLLHSVSALSENRSPLETLAYPPAQKAASLHSDLPQLVGQDTQPTILVGSPTRGSRSTHWQPSWITSRCTALRRSSQFLSVTSAVMLVCCVLTQSSETTAVSCCPSTLCRWKCAKLAEESLMTRTRGRCHASLQVSTLWN